MTEQTPLVQPPSLREMFPVTKAPRRYTPWQVAPFCERLVEVMNKMLPAQFTLTRDGDWALTIQVDIRPPQIDAETDAESDSGRDA